MFYQIENKIVTTCSAVVLALLMMPGVAWAQAAGTAGSTSVDELWADDPWVMMEEVPVDGSLPVDTFVPPTASEPVMTAPHIPALLNAAPASTIAPAAQPVVQEPAIEDFFEGYDEYYVEEEAEEFEELFEPVVQAAPPVVPVRPVPAEQPRIVQAPKTATEDPLAGEYEYGDFSSQALTVRAWESLILEEYDGVHAYTTKCIAMYESKAREQQQSLRDFAPEDRALKYWALNDVATSYFIRARAHALEGRNSQARADMQHIIDRFGFAQAWDSRGWFWRIADAARDQLTTIGTPYDYGDYTSQTLATKGWQALDAQDYTGVELYATKNIELYGAEARKQQASLSGFASEDTVYEYWALNDVATAYFQMGEAHTAKKEYRNARQAYQTVIDELSYAQVWDPKGWFWKVGVASQGRLRKIRAKEKRGW